jgi:hypothetical protein
MKDIPASGNSKQFFYFFPIGRDEDSFQQRLLCEQRLDIVHEKIAWHKMIVSTLLFISEHLPDADVIQLYQGKGPNDVASKPACDAVLREQAPELLVFAYGKLRVIPIINDLNTRAKVSWVETV